MEGFLTGKLRGMTLVFISPLRKAPSSHRYGSPIPVSAPRTYLYRPTSFYSSPSCPRNLSNQHVPKILPTATLPPVKHGPFLSKNALIIQIALHVRAKAHGPYSGMPRTPQLPSQTICIRKYVVVDVTVTDAAKPQSKISLSQKCKLFDI